MEDVPQEVAENTAVNGRDANGRFVPGNSGRPPMSQGKVSKIIRECFAEFLRSKVEGTDELERIYQELTPKEKARFLIEIKQFNVPKFQSVTITDEKETQELRIDPSKLTTDEIRTVLALNEKMRI